MEHASFASDKPFRSLVTSAIKIFIISTALQDDFVIGIPLDAPQNAFPRVNTAAGDALFCRNTDIGRSIGKVRMETAERFCVIAEIADAEELSAAEQTEIENNVV